MKMTGYNLTKYDWLWQTGGCGTEV